MFEQTSTAPENTAQNLQKQKEMPHTAGSSGAEESTSDRPVQSGLPSAAAEEQYAELKLPQGMEDCLENFAAFKKLAAELKLPCKTVQKLVEWEARAAADGRQNAQTRRAEILQRWTEQTREMFGPGYQKELARALDAADRFGGPELRALLDATGLGGHPAVVKTFYEISRQIGEDQSVSGRARGGEDKTFAEALYGKAQ